MRATDDISCLIVFSTLFVALSTKDISGLLLLCEAFKKLAPMREVLSVRME